MGLFNNLDQGITVHFIDEKIDRGEIIHQEKVPVYKDDKIYHIHQRVISRQPRALMKSLELLEKNVQTYPAGKGTLFHQMTEDEERLWIRKQKRFI